MTLIGLLRKSQDMDGVTGKPHDAGEMGHRSG